MVVQKHNSLTYKHEWDCERRLTMLETYSMEPEKLMVVRWVGRDRQFSVHYQYT